MADIALAIGLTAACCLVRGLFDPILAGNLPTLPAAVAAILAARWLGFAPGLVALAAGLVASDCLFARPRADWSAALVRDAASLLVSAAVGALVVWIIAQLRTQAVLLAREVAERKQAVAQAGRSEALLRRLIDVQEREKQRLCHEFHDGLMQFAIAARMVLEGWRVAHPGPDAAAIDEAIGCLDDGITDGRRAIRGIRPAVLDDLGLKAAMEEFAGTAVGAGPTIEATVDPAVDRVSPNVQTTAFRIVQEATANARRHSGTDRLRIDARLAGDELLLRVEDYGRGFDPATVPRTGFGILGMLQRARLVGGDCTIDSAPGRGTTVLARLPAAGE